MRHSLRILVLTIGFALFVPLAEAKASRLAVIALSSPYGQAPVERADALTSHLIARGYRTIPSADAKARLLSGNTGAGASWAADLAGVVRRGREALTRLDRHGAESARREARRAIERVGGGAGGAEVLVAWALLESAVAASSGNAARARHWFDRAATLGPDVVLDPVLHAEQERSALRDAVQRVCSQPPGKIQTVTVPAGAQLWIDGVKRCRTTCSASVAPGKHYVRITSAAHSPAVFSVNVRSDETVTRRVGLTSAYTGASLGSIRAMLDNPSRSAEAQSALAAVAQFLDVDRVVVVRQTKSETFSLRVAPAIEGNDAFRGGLGSAAVAPSVEAMIRGSARDASSGTASESGAWYESPTLWVGLGAAVVVAAGAGLLLSRDDEPSRPSQGTLVIGGP